MTKKNKQSCCSSALLALGYDAHNWDEIGRTLSRLRARSTWSWQGWPVVPAIVRQLRSPDPSWWNDLPTILSPTLVIGGGPTSHVSQEKLAEVAQLIPDGRFVTIDGAGHLVHENCPQEYKDLLRDFLFG